MTRVVPFVVLVGLAIYQVAVGLGGWGKFVFSRPGYSDFGNYYLYARVGLHDGWSALYDLAIQRREWLAMGGSPVIPWFPIIYPPPLAWLVAPFTVLPLPIAYVAWTALLLALVLVTWGLLKPRGGALSRWTALAAAFSVYPVIFGLLLGQVLIFELAAVAAAWWCLERRREVLAGLLLVAILLKPQVAVLVPLALLLTGRWKTFGAWFGGSAIVALVATVTTGPDGVHVYISRIATAAAGAPQFLVPTDLKLDGLLGHDLLTTLVRVAIVAATVTIAFRYRRRSVSVPLAAALVGSIVITPYLHVEDQATLLVAGAIALRGGVSTWEGRLLIAGYALLVGYSLAGSSAVGHVLGPMLLAAAIIWLVVVLGNSLVASFHLDEMEPPDWPAAEGLAA